MKNIQKLSINLLLVAGAIGLLAFQKNEVPKNVLNTFTKMFPTAKKIDWNKESDDEWEAEYEIKKNSIPENIMSVITSEFPNYKIEEAEISETKDGMVYEFEIEKGESEMEIIVTRDGHIIKKEELKEVHEKE